MGCGGKRVLSFKSTAARGAQAGSGVILVDKFVLVWGNDLFGIGRLELGVDNFQSTVMDSTRHRDFSYYKWDRATISGPHRIGETV
jgi:hypothetical protein